MQCKVKIIKEILELFPECRPQVGKVYDANYTPKTGRSSPEMAVIVIQGKPIVVRKNEFELVEGGCGI